MNLRSLAAGNVWRNRGRYLAYLGSAGFSVMIYFLDTSLAHHPYFAGGYRGATYVVTGIQSASVVIAVFTLLFLKLFFMVISLVLRLPQESPLYTAWPVWRQTLLVFGGSFLLVSLLSLYGVLRRNIIELIRVDRQPLETPRFLA